ncbi:SLATT domain-containing protein [Streptomyces sp. NPDC087422]|uniref:SLATT domain-containing protein n=1 Tax=Streptomyces sp. NPDC087422 TaxID=3365786 RepID=UPI00380B6160
MTELDGGGTPTGASGTGRRQRQARDLGGRPFPDIAVEGPDGQREALARLRAWAEQEAQDAIDWYQRDKRRKRTASRTLQALAIALAVAGTAVPLATAASGGSGQGWGYVLLALAAGCKGFDHFFGLSAGWMRDITVAHALRGELNAVRLEWAADVLRAGPGGAAARTSGPLEPAEVERQLALIARLVTTVRGHVESETVDWRTDLSARIRQLNEADGGLSGAAVPAAPGGPGGASGGPAASGDRQPLA